MQSQTTRVQSDAARLVIFGAAWLAVSPMQAQEHATPMFSHANRITHPYLPLTAFKGDVFEGQEEGKTVRVVHTRKPTKKTFVINGKQVTPVAIEDREFEDGKLKEVTIDYFAQDDAGAVYYLGEEVDEYQNDRVVGHGGAWEYGKGKAALGVMLPANPKVGDKFQSENVPGVTTEDDEVVSTTETVKTPLGTYSHCIKVKEMLSDGGVEYKVYARGVGMVVDDKLQIASRK